MTYDIGRQSARSSRVAVARVVDALSDAQPGALGDDGLQAGRLGGRLEQDLAADGEAEAADAVGVDVGAAFAGSRRRRGCPGRPPSESVSPSLLPCPRGSSSRTP